VTITLVIPPSGFLLDEKVFPSLGVLKVAAVLEQSGHAVDVLDLSGIADVDQAVRDHVEAHASSVYGLTATMPQMPSAVQIAALLRQLRPDARLVLGGPHVTLMNASARQERLHGRSHRAIDAMQELADRFDVLVCGDGERAVHVALKGYAPKVIDADDPTCSMFLTKQDLNDLPFAARHLIDLESYHYQIDGVPTQSMIAQLGCPFGCTFCGGRRSPFLRRVRTRTTAEVIREMRHLYDTYGTRGFMFLDDELNVNPSFLELLAAMVTLQGELGVEFRLRGLLKSELVTEPMAEAMYRAGFRQVLIGFESGDPRMLLNMQKHATREDNTRCVERLHRQGLTVKALMSFGHAGETADSCEATRDWLLDVEPDDFDVTIITVYPGTPYYDDAVETQPGIWTYTAKNGDRLHAKHVDQLTDVNFYKGIPGSYQSFVYTDALSGDELVALRDDVEDDVRRQLGVAYPTSAAAKHFEHSMGMN
jgi:anaerobic magnesium-protoporphyrin IX monomethyl ester cyclase